MPAAEVVAVLPQRADEAGVLGARISMQSGAQLDLLSDNHLEEALPPADYVDFDTPGLVRAHELAALERERQERREAKRGRQYSPSRTRRGKQYRLQPPRTPGGTTRKPDLAGISPFSGERFEFWWF